MSDIMKLATEAVGKIAAEIGVAAPKISTDLNGTAMLHVSADARGTVLDTSLELLYLDAGISRALLRALGDTRRAVFVWYSGSDFWSKMYDKLYAPGCDVRKTTLDADTWYLTDIIAGYTCTLVFCQHRIVNFIRLDDAPPAVSDEEAFAALDGID